MDFFTIMDDLTLYGVDIAVISGVTCTIVQILKRTVLKNCNKKVLTFLPFVIGTVLYAVFAAVAHLDIGYLLTDLPYVCERGFTIGSLSTVLYVLYEQFIREREQTPVTEGVISVLMEGYLQADDAAAKIREQFEEKKRTRDRYSDELSDLRVRFATAESGIQKVKENVDRVKGELETLKTSLDECKAKIGDIIEGLEKARRGIEDMSVADIYKPKLERLNKDIKSAEQYRLTIDGVIAKLTVRKDEIQGKAIKIGSDKAKKESALERIDDAINTLLERLSEEYMIHSYEEAAAHRVPDFDREAAASEITRLKREKSALGNVNLDSIQDYDTVSVEYESQKKEYDDLIAARADFEKIINDLSNQMLYQFNTEFAKIQDNFQEIFKELFGGGTGKLELEVPEDGDMLEAGVEIYAQPPGKLLKSMSLLSGGEKALTAIAILFAILRLRPMPFVILDETEAALDDTNVEVFARYLHKFSSTTQFIVVTHRKPTMELADRLYGVTMQEKGVSTVVSVTLSEAVKHSSND